MSWQALLTVTGQPNVANGMGSCAMAQIGALLFRKTVLKDFTQNRVSLLCNFRSIYTPQAGQGTRTCGVNGLCLACWQL